MKKILNTTKTQTNGTINKWKPYNLLRHNVNPTKLIY